MVKPSLRWALKAGLVVCLSMSPGLRASTGEISISAQAIGTIGVEMPGLSLVGSLAGKIEQTGSIFCPEQRVDFTATGEFVGTGYRDLLSFGTEAWATYHVSGSTLTGQVIELLGVLYLRRFSESLLRIGDELAGSQYVCVTINGSEQHFSGDFSGSLVRGGFVLEPGMFLALAGEAALALRGDTTEAPDDAILSIPFPSAPWAWSFAETLRSRFSWLPWPIP
ncbi:hypothetical protein JW848_03310 [Candidatus Bipolaricaulota bacterium]|nr:hypothetical protein [Candidatus Bipolaricaulota bacterium]